MANVTKHTFVSAKADGADATLVRPSNWNAEHTFAGGAEGQTLVWVAAQSDKAGWAYQSRILSQSTTAVGNVGIGEDDLISYTMPANTLGATGTMIRVRAWGITAGNANVKTIKFKFGTASVTLNPVTAAPNAQDWYMEATVIRTGAATQEMIVQAAAGVIPQVLNRSAPTQDLTAAVVIKLTGEATANDDISQKALVVEILN